MQLLSVLVSVPVVVVVLALAFADPVADLLRRVTEATFPGGGIKAHAQQTPTSETPTPVPAPEPPTTTKNEPEQLANLKAIETRANENLRIARHYWMLYLGLALSGASVDSLRWLAAQTREMTPYQDFVTYLQNQLGVREPAAIANTWQALQTNQMADAHGGMVNATLNGKIFLRWIDGQWRPLEQELPDV